MKPVIVLNMKTYEESTAEKGVKLCEIAEQVSKESGVQIFVCPQTVLLAQVIPRISIPVFAQHVDSSIPGPATGHTTWESLKAIGCKGSLVNHSEHRLKFFEVIGAMRGATKLGMETIICTATAAESKAVATTNPSFISIEPPELIGSGISVSTTRPELVLDTIEAVASISKDIPVLCGAGISTAIDVKKSIELGAKGVLLASAFVKAKNPKEKLAELASGVP